MARDLTSGVQTEIDSTDKKPLLLTKFELDGGDLRLWNGIGTLTFSSESYVGGGKFVSVGAISETLEVRAVGAEFNLNGVDSSIVSTILSENIRFRPVTLWMGFFDDTYSLVADPFILFKGSLSDVEIVEGPEKSDITVKAENRLLILEKASERRYTPEDQKLDYPNDKGLDFVHTLNNGKKLQWGR